MAHITSRIEVRDSAHHAYEAFFGERRQALVGVEDDMWAAFADTAEPHGLFVDDELVGSCSIDEDDQLHAFHVGQRFEDVASEVLAHVVDAKHVTAAMASTVDPAFLSLALSAGGPVEPVALMYEHVAEPATAGSVEVRLAGPEDHGAAVVFDTAATDGPADFLEGFLAERIERGELYLVSDEDGQIIATGECRVDTRAGGHAHLGLVVGTNLRSRGLGTQLLHTLVKTTEASGLTPLCSTEPTNLAAQRIIRRVGFRSRHRVFRIQTGSA